MGKGIRNLVSKDRSMTRSWKGLGVFFLEKSTIRNVEDRLMW